MHVINSLLFVIVNDSGFLDDVTKICKVYPPIVTCSAELQLLTSVYSSQSTFTAYLLYLGKAPSVSRKKRLVWTY